MFFSSSAPLVSPPPPFPHSGWVPFDEDDPVSMGADAADPRGTHPAGAAGAGDVEERSSSFDTTSLSSASDTEDVWTISDEQREYYITQFKTMQVNGAASTEERRRMIRTGELHRWRAWRPDRSHVLRSLTHAFSLVFRRTWRVSSTAPWPKSSSKSLACRFTNSPRYGSCRT